MEPHLKKQRAHQKPQHSTARTNPLLESFEHALKLLRTALEWTKIRPDSRHRHHRKEPTHRHRAESCRLVIGFELGKRKTDWPLPPRRDTHSTRQHGRHPSLRQTPDDNQWTEESGEIPKY
jgi:hypothetical protein